eukprot:gene19122-24958_t
MSKSGKESALNLYDCKGWVAHGFMDGYMNTGLAGEAQWSLCITCGAWLALSLWDAVTYSIDTNFIVDNKVNNKKAFKDNDNNNKYRFKITESFDPGHRHFSSLHWVYPGLFLPNCSGNNNYGCNNIYQSAIETLAFKRQGSGGHTSWSAAWESCLYARLGSGNEAWTALIRIASKYITSRYLSLHPPTTPIQSKREGTCKTCYTEKTTSNDDKILPNQNRGLLTQGRHVFQLDGNLGFIAGVNEMLIHSHIPGVVNILPAVSTSLSNFGGRIQGFVARGGIEISMSWTGAKKFKPTIDSSDTLTYYSGNGGKVFGLSLYLSSYHPWYGYNPNEKSVSSMIETSPA